MVAKILFYIYLTLSILALGERYGFIPLDAFYLSIFCGLPEEICYFTNPIHQRFIDFFRFFGDWAFVPVIAAFVLSILMAFSARIGGDSTAHKNKKSDIKTKPPIGNGNGNNGNNVLNNRASDNNNSANQPLIQSRHTRQATSNVRPNNQAPRNIMHNISNAPRPRTTSSRVINKK